MWVVGEESARRFKAAKAACRFAIDPQALMLHRQGLDKLETEMMSFSRDWDVKVDGLPNRLEAMI